MKLTERRSQDVEVGRTCDSCGKAERDMRVYQRTWYSPMWHPFEFVDDWEEVDVCSGRCFVVALREFVSDSDHDGASMGRMPLEFARDLLRALDIRSVAEGDKPVTDTRAG